MDGFIVKFPGGKKVEVSHGNHSILTDQPLDNGGDDAGMSPFDLFLSSIIACSAVVAIGFIRRRNLSTEDLKIAMYPDYDEEANVVSKLKIEIEVPDDFPEKYIGALEKAIETCTVKKHLIKPPAFEVVIK